MKKLFATLCLSVFCFVSFSQNPVSSVQINPSYPSATTSQVSGMDTETRAHVQTDLSVEINLSSVVNMGKIAVKVGLVEGSSDLFYKEFEFDTPGTFADGTSYSRSGNIVTIGIGSFSGYGKYYTEVVAIRTNGSAETGVRTVLN